MTFGGNNENKSQNAASLNSPREAPSIPSTPLRHSTAASSNRSSNVSQADLKLAVRDELLGSMSESDQLATSTPVPLEIIQEIKKSLPTWPTGLDEPGYYTTIKTTFDLVRDALNKDKSFRQTKHVYDGHELFINDPHDIKDSVDGSARLRPDLVYVPREKVTGNDQSFRWRDIDIVIEVKNDWRDLIKQAATYARALFCSNWTRSFALVIGVNQVSKSARFMFFHRGGVTSSPELPMTPKAQDDSGFRGFVQMMKTIFGWRSPEEAGFVARRVDQDPVFGAIDILSSRTCIRGRANQVAILIKKASASGTSTPQPEITLRRSRRIEAKLSLRLATPKSVATAPLSEEGKSIRGKTSQGKTGQGKASQGKISQQNPNLDPEAARQGIERLNLSDSASAKTAKKRPTYESAQPREDEALSDALAIYESAKRDVIDRTGGNSPPLRLVYKDSWVSQGDTVEVDVYRAVRGEFGVPRLWATQRLGNNSGLLKGATEWNPFKDDVPWKVEPREHIRQYYSTVGKPLSSCETPYAFLLSITHAMIGHYNLLSKAHAIHRDVSEGNILAVDEEATEDNKAVFETLGIDLKKGEVVKCRGILIDGDLAKQIGSQRQPEPGKAISGTVPFMSFRLLDRWVGGHDIYHNPNDDLESGAWVALIGGLEKTVANNEGNVSATERDWLRRLNSPAVDTVLAVKGTISKWATRSRAEPHAFYGLIARWLSHLDDIAVADKFGTRYAMSEERYRPSYQIFVREGLTWLEAHEKVLSGSWGDCFRSQKTPEDW